MDTNAFRRRAEGLMRFARWERDHPHSLEPHVAIAGIGWIWHLMPAKSRERPLDVSGIARMRQALAVLR